MLSTVGRGFFYHNATFQFILETFNQENCCTLILGSETNKIIMPLANVYSTIFQIQIQVSLVIPRDYFQEKSQNTNTGFPRYSRGYEVPEESHGSLELRAPDFMSLLGRLYYKVFNNKLSTISMFLYTPFTHAFFCSALHLKDLTLVLLSNQP